MAPWGECVLGVRDRGARRYDEAGPAEPTGSPTARHTLFLPDVGFVVGPRYTLFVGIVQSENLNIIFPAFGVHCGTGGVPGVDDADFQKNQ